VTGVNVGAQSYWDALATMLMHTRGALIMTPRASMVLTSRAALEASGAVSAEDAVAIGGFERIMGPNGEVQYFANYLADAYRILYQHYRYTDVVPGVRGRAASAELARVECGPDAFALLDARANFFESNLHPNAWGHRKLAEALVTTRVRDISRAGE
jgi:hypothetical protein